MCVFKQRKTVKVAGLRPALTKNFGIQGQVDLIDYAATPDGPCKCLLNYQDHTIKLAYTKPLTSRSLVTITYALLTIFTVIGPPSILQSDDAGEFSNIAYNS